MKDLLDSSNSFNVLTQPAATGYSASFDLLLRNASSRNRQVRQRRRSPCHRSHGKSNSSIRRSPLQMQMQQQRQQQQSTRSSRSRPARSGSLPLGLNLLLLLLLSAASVPKPASGFSFSRTLHDVEQDVAEDASLYSQEMRLGEAPDLNANPQKGNHLEKYVTIKESPSSYASVPRGHRLELKCEVDGSPPPRIYWVMGENPGRQVEQLERESVADVSYTAIARELSKLTIDCVGPQDQSLVHCVGVSGDKMVISQPTVLNVEGGNGTCESAASAPVITRHRPLYFSEMGSTVVLPCEAQGKPRPRVYWLDGEGNPLMDPRFVVQPNGNLVIANIRWQDMDGYKCLAKSPLGEAEAVTFLYPAAKSESEKRKANAL